VFATNTSLCNATATRITSPEQAKASIRTTEGFKQVTRNMPAKVISLRYTDTKVQEQGKLIMAQQFWPMLALVAQKVDLQLPPMLPPADDIVKHLGPACAYSWFDEDGLRSHSRGPVPEGSAALVVGGAGMGTAILLPALARARGSARRAGSAANLKQVYVAVDMYANDHKGKFPDDLETLVDKDLIQRELLNSPCKPSDFTGPSYIYITGFSAESDPRNIVAYENPAFSSEGTNALFVDGHVQWLKPDAFRKKLTETYKRIGRPVPKITFKRPGKHHGEFQGLFKNLEGMFTPKAKPSRRARLGKKIPFKCTACGHVEIKTLRELRELTKSPADPTKLPKFTCPKCGRKTLTRAVACPKCGEIFILKMDPAKGVYDGRCPKCGADYGDAWREKHLGNGK